MVSTMPQREMRIHGSQERTVLSNSQFLDQGRKAKSKNIKREQKRGMRGVVYKRYYVLISET